MAKAPDAPDASDEKKDEKKTLYEQLGLNDESMGQVVAAFYENVMQFKDDTGKTTLAPYFKGANMIDLKKNQSAFLTLVFDGPKDKALEGKIAKAGGVAEYLTASHAKLHIPEKAFNEVAQCLQDTLTQLKISKDLIDQVMAIVGSVKGAIVESKDAKKTLYEKLGLNDESMGQVVAAFYENVMKFKDDKGQTTLAPYFQGANMVDLKKNQSAFLTLVFDGPKDKALEGKIAKAGGVAEYLTASHAKLHIPEKAFNEVAHCLQETLTQLKISKDLIDQVMAIVGSVKGAIVEAKKA